MDIMTYHQNRGHPAKGVDPEAELSLDPQPNPHHGQAGDDLRTPDDRVLAHQRQDRAKRGRAPLLALLGYRKDSPIHKKRYESPSPSGRGRSSTPRRPTFHIFLDFKHMDADLR